MPDSVIDVICDTGGRPDAKILTIVPGTPSVGSITSTGVEGIGRGVGVGGAVGVGVVKVLMVNLTTALWPATVITIECRSDGSAGINILV